MGNKVLETEFIDYNSTGTVKTMLDGTKIRIGKNVENFYERLLNLSVSYKCQLLNLDAIELKNFIKEREEHYNNQLILIFQKKWVWRIDSETYNFSDKEINYDLFRLSLDKNQILSKLKRNTFEVEKVIELIAFFDNSEDLKEDYEE